MKKLTTKLALHAACVALFATGTIILPTLNAFKPAGIGGHAFAKDGDSGESGSGSDGGNSGSGSESGNSGSGSDSRDSDSDGGGNHDGNSGSSSRDGSDDSDDRSENNSSDDDNDDSRGRESRERPEVTVSLSPEQTQAILSGQSKLVDNLGRTLELEIEIENGVATYTAKPHGGDARRNPGPISDVSVVSASTPSASRSTNDDGTPDRGSGDN
jgi:hypothetical protein